MIKIWQRHTALFIITILFLCSFGRKQADMVVYNAHIYTVDGKMSIAEAFAIKDGKFIAVGTNQDILAYDAKEKIDAKGKSIYPGFFDAHCHFYAYGKMKNECDLIGTNSYEEVLARIIRFAKEHPDGWLIGRGWDQNNWATKQFPDKKKLDSLFPTRPVYLARVDGHATLVNQAALDIAGINANTSIAGGDIIIENGRLTGVLVDNAADRVKSKIPSQNRAEIQKALLEAQQDCFKVGLTTVDDAGLEKNIIDIIDAMQKDGKLNMRIYAMLTDNYENRDYYLSKGPYKTDKLNVSSFKFYADGALGSRGACLLQPYSDSSEHYGFLLNKPEYFKAMAKKIAASKFQMNTHCIGDSGVRFILDTYGEVLGKKKNDRRWRIEHAQVVNEKDFSKFGDYSIIPSVQPTHATSDMKWAAKRLGPDRVKGAYAYKELLKQNGMVANGSDFPVEGINPLLGFYAAVARKSLDGKPIDGFQMENALTREEALKGMTIWAAYANFQEKETGSIEVGKKADYVILEQDIMLIDLKEIPLVKVISTIVGGQKVYGQ